MTMKKLILCIVLSWLIGILSYWYYSVASRLTFIIYQSSHFGEEDSASSSIALDLEHPCLPDEPRTDTLFNVPGSKLGFPEAGDYYYCHNCDQGWRRTSESITTDCCVMHRPGDCCHFKEKLVISERDDQVPIQDTNN